jgi:3-hydroxyisobutyrate dehydrogenase-like beta-hydroxyacid dehydrogenase
MPTLSICSASFKVGRVGAVSGGTTSVGVIGLGPIGTGAARLVQQAGHPVVGFDVRAEALAELAGVVEPAASVAELADRTEVVLVAVFDDAQVRDVVGGILAAGQPPAVLVVLSTVALETVQWAAAECAPRGIRVVDCGVSGGRSFARGEPLVAMVGGDEEAVELARPVLEAFGDPVLYMGGLGSGMITKVARNMLHYCGIAAEWEGARLATSAGIDVERFAEAVRACERLSGGTMGYGTSVPVDGDLQREEHVARYALKDLDVALELGEAKSVDLPAATLAKRLFGAFGR